MGSGGSGGGGNSIADIIVKSSRQRRQISHEQFMAVAGIEQIRVSGKEDRKTIKKGGQQTRKTMDKSAELTDRLIDKGVANNLRRANVDHQTGTANIEFGKPKKAKGSKSATKLGRKMAEGFASRANELRDITPSASVKASGSGKSASTASSQRAIGSPRKAIAAGMSKKKKTASEIIAGKTAQQNARVGSPERSASGAIVSKQGPKRVNGAIPANQRGKLRGAKLNRPY
jgi:hypothetical protein